MCHFRQADITADRDCIQDLFCEHLTWVNAGVTEKLGVGFDVQATVANDMATLDMFLPPQGRLTLATVGKDIAGLGCLRTIAERTGELKRMYVRPQFRRRGVGRALVHYLIGQATKMGHRTVRLDTGWFMAAAQALYHSAGFSEIPPYPESEIPQEIHHLWVFMQKDLELDA